jgi:histidinol-phosphate aminotransferase
VPLRYLRPGLPTSAPLTVSRLPTVAKLDQNESPAGLPEALVADFAAELARAPWHRYPQPSEYDAAREHFADALGLDPEGVALTAGCDQAIEGAHFLAGGPGRRALVFEPTYPMLAHAGLLAGTEVTRIDLGVEYDLKPEHLDRPAELVLVASPNNPTGRRVPAAVIAHALAAERFVFVDEAYHDFSGVTVAGLVAEHPNLMVGRSCSKSLLAGMRLGYAIARPEVARRLDLLLTAPYHLGHAQLLLARRFAEILPHVRASAAQTVAERERLAAALRGLGVEVEPSEANFLLLRVDRAAEVYAGLARAGVRVRYAPRIPGLEGRLRVTVGLAAQSELLIAELRRLL